MLEFELEFDLDGKLPKEEEECCSKLLSDFVPPSGILRSKAERFFDVALVTLDRVVVISLFVLLLALLRLLLGLMIGKLKE